MAKRTDVMKPTVYGKGYLGSNIPILENGKRTVAYCRWKDMLKRCYSTKYQTQQPTYIGCQVCEEWLNFTIFEAWFRENHVDGWALDKDLLFANNKVYSPETCVFIPQEINNVLGDSAKARGKYPQGVSYDKSRDLFRACLNKNGRHEHIGRFSDPYSAYVAYREEKLRYVTHMVNQYEFSREIKEAALNTAKDKLPKFPKELTISLI